MVGGLGEIMSCVLGAEVGEGCERCGLVEGCGKAGD